MLFFAGSAPLAALAGRRRPADLLRTMHPTELLFTWWDYRMLGFPKNRGLRIDHVLVTPALAARAASGVDRDREKASSLGYAAVWAEFDSDALDREPGVDRDDGAGHKGSRRSVNAISAATSARRAERATSPWRASASRSRRRRAPRPATAFHRPRAASQAPRYSSATPA